jgi:hypothetical protein
MGMFHSKDICDTNVCRGCKKEFSIGEHVFNFFGCDNRNRYALFCEKCKNSYCDYCGGKCNGCQGCEEILLVSNREWNRIPAKSSYGRKKMGDVLKENDNGSHADN